MKTLKLFALTALLAVGANAMAAVVTHSNGTFTYTYDDAANPMVATITGFVAELSADAKKTVSIPTQVFKQDNTNKINVTAIDAEAFLNETAIETVTIPEANVATIGARAFKGCTSLTTVSIGKKVGEIGDDAFKGCTSLETVNFSERAAGATDPNLTIAAGTFAETAIVTLDLSKSKVQTVNPLFEELNTTLTTIKLPATLTLIADNAFKNLATLATVDYSEVTSDFEIGADAFSGVPAIKNPIMPAKLKVLRENALHGSNIQMLTITSNTTNGYPVIHEQNAAKLKTLYITGNFKGVIGDDNAGKPAFTALTTVTFEGTVAASALTAGAFSGCANLTTVTFNGNLTALAVKDGAFAKGTPATLTINYGNANASSPVNPFEDEAFSADGGEGNYVTLVTSRAFADRLKQEDGNTAHSETAGEKIYSLHVDAPAAPEATYELKVNTGGTSKYYYAKFVSANAYKIAKEQNGATIIVYYGYVDESDATIYMENGRIINGYYWIPANQPVIVKSTASANVSVKTSDGSANSFPSPAANGFYVVPGANTTGLAIKDAAAALTKIPYFLAPFADYGYLWSKFKDERILVGSTAGVYNSTTKETTADFIINCPDLGALSPNLNVVWLDGSEENTTTGIENIDAAKDQKNGVIYNLAGQKVGADFKGIVIKNGKKFVVK